MPLYGLTASDVAILKEIAQKVKHTPVGGGGAGSRKRRISSDAAQRIFVLASAEDTPSAGYHTFKRATLPGLTIAEDATSYESCLLLGDKNGNWDISVAEGSETFGELLTINGQYYVLILPYPGKAYYYE